MANYLILRPRKGSVLGRFRIPESEELTRALTDAGLHLTSYSRSSEWETYGVRITHDDLDRVPEVLRDLVHRSMAWLGRGNPS